MADTAEMAVRAVRADTADPADTADTAEMAVRDSEGGYGRDGRHGRSMVVLGSLCLTATAGELCSFPLLHSLRLSRAVFLVAFCSGLFPVRHVCCILGNAK